MQTLLSAVLQQYSSSFYPVIPLLKDSRVLPLNLSQSNAALVPGTITDTGTFLKFINQTLQQAGCSYGIGGYNELRNLYARSAVFNGEEPRRLHLGVDIWGASGTPVFLPASGKLHSLAYNGSFGDYGATLIFQHQLDGLHFHTLYGHLSLASLKNKTVGQELAAGEMIATFGLPEENGNWPPHLHFQIIENMEGLTGDYPGVCRFSEKEKYLRNCPDANLMLRKITEAANRITAGNL